MQEITRIRILLSQGSFDFSRHAFLRAVERNISDLEILEVGQNAEIVEDYPDDKYSPSTLILGFTRLGRPLHLQVSCFPPDRIRIITLYEPDPVLWGGFRRRK